MTIEEYRKDYNNSKNYFSDPTASFSDYLNNPEGKYVIAITKSQYIFKADIVGEDHAVMAADIIRKIRPDLEIDGWGNSLNNQEDFREHNILIFGYPKYSYISLPEKEMLSPEQYKELEQILLNIKDYNEKKPYNRWGLDVDAPITSNIESGNYETNIDNLLMSLEDYITEDYKITQEKFIGKPISENEYKEQYKNSI